jgi:RHS repeat-associated protein
MRVRAGHDSGQGDVWDTRFYYDSGSSPYAYLFESDNDKSMTVAYTVGPSGNLISQRRSASTYYHVYDQLGSTRKLVDSNQATTDSYAYYAFGDVRSSSGSTGNPFKFVGRLGYYDDLSTDLRYLRTRYCNAGHGRFLSPDPMSHVLVGPSAAGFRYAYVANRPTVGLDPSGLHGYWGCLGEMWAQVLNPIGPTIPLLAAFTCGAFCFHWLFWCPVGWGACATACTAFLNYEFSDCLASRALNHLGAKFPEQYPCDPYDALDSCLQDWANSKDPCEYCPSS